MINEVELYIQTTIEEKTEQTCTRRSASKNAKTPYHTVITSVSRDSYPTRDLNIVIQSWSRINDSLDLLNESSDFIEELFNNTILKTDNFTIHSTQDSRQFEDDEELAGLQMVEQTFTMRIYEGRKNK